MFKTGKKGKDKERGETDERKKKKNVCHTGRKGGKSRRKLRSKLGMLVVGNVQ